MHKRESIRILYVVHLFKYRGRKRVPIDIIKASAFRHQAKCRCLGWANHRTPFGRPRYAHVSLLRSECNSTRRRVECVALFWLHRSTGSLRRKRI